MTNVPQTQAAPTPGRLRSGALSSRHLVFFVLSAAAPLTTMVGFVALAFLIGGIATPSGYLIAGLVYALFAVGFSAMSKHVRNAGAFYAYITLGLGRQTGAAAALTGYAGYALGEVGFCAAAGLFASSALDTIAGVQVSWQVCALLIGALVGVVAYFRVSVGAKVLAFLLLCEFAVLGALIVAIFIQGTPEGYSFDSFNPSAWESSALSSLFVITFIVYIGFEQTAVYGEEVKDPERMVPRATYIAVGLLATVFTFASWVILMAIGPNALGDKLQSGDPAMLVFGLTHEYLGKTMTDTMQVLIVTSFFAGVLAMHNAASRYLFAMGRAKLLPAGLAHTDPRSGSPITAVIVQAVFLLGLLSIFAMSGADPYTQVVIWMSTPTLVAVLILQILTSVSVIRFFGQRPGTTDHWRGLVAPILSTASLGVVLYLICSKMSVLTGLGPLGNFLINVPLIAAFVGGLIRSLYLHRQSEDDLEEALVNEVEGQI
ncbi:amino acid permease [Aeromicrobium sp. Root344]|uniref:APC family permease n=1 Tax=Aeromicrobium sp. Root344 TaxID=1736521 RepID=UPI0006F3755B|nr:APC family permease [Aeromicrobium sp. Root344]KQV75383.1 amino acid permease [Aeromicrobium sp. Root344]